MPTILGRLFEDRQPLVGCVVSNDVPNFVAGDIAGPAAQIKIPVKALIDTGATNSAIDKSIQQQMMLLPQGNKQVMFPNMAAPEHHPVYPCELFFTASMTDDKKLHQWPDFPDMLAFDLSGRAFQAVIGMDILGQGTLRIEKSGAVVVEFC